MIWQRKASIAVAIVGVGLVGGVYIAIGTRQARVMPPPPKRVDPTAILETSGAVVQQVRGMKEDYQIKAQRQLLYAGGSSRSLDVEITVRGKEGRDFVMTAKEARGGEKNSTVDIAGAVTLTANDGFVLTTEHATFNDADGIIRAAGALAFHRGGMSGTGVGMTYDKNNDILTILDQAHVQFLDQAGAVTMQFDGGGATLTRRDHILFVDRNVHAVRGGQTIDAITAKARLTETDEQVTFIELRGNSRVVGGSSAFDSMSAFDIDLDYTDDGVSLERVRLSGKAAIALTGAQGAPGRQFFGETLKVGLDSGNNVTSIAGTGNVRLDLPGTTGTPRRSIRAATLEAAGPAGKGLENATFSENVEYQEDAAAAGGQPRVARSRSLTAALTSDAIANAVFTGAVTFTEQGLQAGAARAEYNPDAGSLDLSGAEAGGGPRVANQHACGAGAAGRPYVADQDVCIAADGLDVTLAGHHMVAKGTVKTILQPQRSGSNGKLPGLLNGQQAANANATALEYDGEHGSAIYSGDVQLWQGDTAIRAERIVLDRNNGDLLAASDAPDAARTSMTMDQGATLGRAQEIRYTDTTREIEYRYVQAAPRKPAASATATPDRPATPAAPAVRVTPVVSAQLSGPQGDLHGARIVMLLQKDKNQIDRLEAYDRVSLKLDARNASGGRLTYYAKDERYVMTGTSAAPVKVMEQCRESSGKTLTFFKSADRIIVDGNEERRTQTKSGGGPCPEPRSP